MHKTQRGDGSGDQGDPHLRSVSAVVGTRVRATDGLAGHVLDVVADRSGWEVAGIVVGTAWFAETRHTVPPSSVAEISWSRQEVRLNIDRRGVQHITA